MPRRSRREDGGGWMGKIAGHALKQVVGDPSGRSSRYGSYGGRPSHRFRHDSSDYDSYSMSSYGAPLIPSRRYGRHASGGSLLSGPFGDQLKWKIGNWVVEKFMNPKSVKALIPGMKGDSTSDESSATSSSESDDEKHSRRKPRKSRRGKYDDEVSSDSDDNERRGDRHRPKPSRHAKSKPNRHRSSRRPDREDHRSRHERLKRSHRSRNPTKARDRYGAMPYPAANSYMTYERNRMPLPYH